MNGIIYGLGHGPKSSELLAELFMMYNPCNWSAKKGATNNLKKIVKEEIQLKSLYQLHSQPEDLDKHYIWLNELLARKNGEYSSSIIINIVSETLLAEKGYLTLHREKYV